jgi:endoglucanase
VKYWSILFLLIAGACQAAVPVDRLAILTRGVNVTYLFERKARLAGAIAHLHQSGFRHLRVFVDQDMLNDPVFMRKLDALVEDTVFEKLGIILCMVSRRHPWSDTTDVEASWSEAWRALASHYASVSATYLYPEIANEPGITDGNKWQSIQDRLLREIRKVLPGNTILLTGSPLQMVWSLPDSPSTDPDILYTWHLYQPLIFTTQGAAWTTPELTQFAGLIYPPDRANMESLTNPHTERDLAAYARNGHQRISEEVDLSRAWSQAHNIPLMVTEFGVVRDAPVESRLRWLREARERIEAAHEGWSIWEYEGGFGIEPLVLGSPVSTALGLDAQ